MWDGHVAMIRINLGAVQAAQGDLAAARESYRAALGIDPKDKQAKERLAGIERQLARDPLFEPGPIKLVGCSLRGAVVMTTARRCVADGGSVR